MKILKNLWLSMLLAAFAGMWCNYLLVTGVGLDVLMSQQLDSKRGIAQTLTPDQRATIIESADTSKARGINILSGLLGAVVNSFVVGFLIAAMQRMLGGIGKIKEIVATVGWCVALYYTVKSVLLATITLPIVNSGRSVMFLNPIPTNPGFWLRPDEPVITSAVQACDLLVIGTGILLIFALKRGPARLSYRNAALSTCALWLVGSGVKIGISALV